MFYRVWLKSLKGLAEFQCIKMERWYGLKLEEESLGRYLEIKLDKVNVLAPVKNL